MIRKGSDKENLQAPAVLEQILSATVAADFQMASEPQTGCLLRTLVASKPSGCFLELGTGTGIATAWLLDGMDEGSKLFTVDNDSAAAAIAQKYLGHDQRVSFRVEDAGALIEHFIEQNQRFDLIFADTWIGKYARLEDTLNLLNSAGLYVIDDMLPQINWITGHEANVEALVLDLENRQDLVLTKLAWASGIVLATKKT
ncbi:class I SAM-dependent methyltransferase [Pseudanabaena sp. FACHB-2040]|uniref:O-methyltransferase n=1 Tax=Pseudanabaena sp. FACHB-2040 TaxID=2692859 RepID=UPI001684E3A2|nr:class I SAM-dependent methyltransferase [Pseudanabaena sp. FACHB-2040]MBD2256120.1 class I SAM-dependent methyltransferase [Pseudanabaena sp. FACHB-2040]